MKRLAPINNLSKAEWLRFRKSGLTGTDAGAVVGLNPYRSAFAVYQDKLSEETEDFDNEPMRQGRDLEEYVARRFMEETGLKVHRANAIYYNEEHPIMLADFDRIITGQRAGLECKTVSPYSAGKWAEGRIPLHYQMQVQHYLAVSGFDCWYIAALIFGTEFTVRKIERDEEMIQSLITIEERFWNYNILGRHAPDPDGSDSYSDMLRKLYPRGKREEEIQLYGMEGELARREEIRTLQDKLEKERKVIEQKIQRKLGEFDAVYGTAGAYSVSWVPTVSQRVDTGKLKTEQPDIYKQYLKESSSRRFTVRQEKGAA